MSTRISVHGYAENMIATKIQIATNRMQNVTTNDSKYDRQNFQYISK